MMNAKENFLEAISFGSPDYVPRENEDILCRFSFEDITRTETWTDRWNVHWESSHDNMVPYPKGYPLKSIEQIDDFPFPDPDTLVLSEQTKDALKRIDRSTVILEGHMSYLLFERAWALMSMEEFMMAMITSPDECHELLHKIAAYAKRVFERYMELGADGINFSEDLGSQRGLMISPEMVREFLIPEYEYCFSSVIAAGKIVNFHSCGCVESIVGDLADIGVTMLNPIQARANDLNKIKQSSMGKMALKGGVDTALLLNGKPEQIRPEVIRVMEILKPSGGYMCAPDQHIPGAPPENMDMFWKTAEEFGRYI